MVSFLLGACVAVLYTVLLLGRIDVSAAAGATVLYATYVLLTFSWTTFFSAWMKSPAAAAGLSVLPLFVLPALGVLWKPLGEYGPYGAVAAGTAALGMLGTPTVPIPGSAVISTVLDLGWSVLLVVGAHAVLRRSEL